MAELGGIHQGRALGQVPGLDIGLVDQQQLDHLEVPLFGSQHQCRFAEFITGINIHADGQKPADDLHVPLLDKPQHGFRRIGDIFLGQPRARRLRRNRPAR